MVSEQPDPIQDAGRIIRSKAVAAAWTGGYTLLMLRRWHDSQSPRRHRKTKNPRQQKQPRPPTNPKTMTTNGSTPSGAVLGSRSRPRPHPGRPIYLALPPGPVIGGELVPAGNRSKERLVLERPHSLSANVDVVGRLNRDWSTHAADVVACPAWAALEDRLTRLQRMGLDPVQVMEDLPVKWDQVQRPAEAAARAIDSRVIAAGGIVPHWPGMTAGQSYATSARVPPPSASTTPPVTAAILPPAPVTAPQPGIQP